MKTQKLIELERDRLALIGEARDALAAIEDNQDQKRTVELGKAHDDAMRRYDLLQLDIEEEQLRAQSAAELEARRPDQSGEGYGTDSRDNWLAGKPAKWLDERGDPVRVVSKNETFKERSREGSVGFGDLIRAKISGPRNEAEQRALGESTDSAGGFTVPTPLSATFIDRLRAQTVAIQAGAQTVSMDRETLSMARLETDPTVDWRAENAAITEGDPTFGRVQFQAKSCAGMIRVSRELLMDSINVGSMIEQAFAEAMARRLDFAAIYGAGTGNEPLGVVNTAGVNSVAMATNGAAVTDYDKLLDAIYEMKANDAAEPSAMIANPRTELALAKLKDGDQNPLTVPEMVRRVPLLTTTAAPVDESQGTATNASSIVFGDFSHLMIGMREAINVQYFDQPFVGNGQIAIVAHLRADVQVSQPKSFCKLTGITPA